MFHLTYCPAYSDKTVHMHMVTSTGVKSADNCSAHVLAANLTLPTETILSYPVSDFYETCWRLTLETMPSLLNVSEIGQPVRPNCTN